MCHGLLSPYRYGFNPGSALVIIGSSEVAALAAVNTTISAACGTLSALVVLMLRSYRERGVALWDLLGAGNGTLAGLVAITAGAYPSYTRILCMFT